MRRNVKALPFKHKERRNQLLAQSDWLVTRHRDEVDDGTPTTLSKAQFKALLKYRRELRQWGASSDLSLPSPPEGLGI